MANSTTPKQGDSDNDLLTKIARKLDAAFPLEIEVPAPPAAVGGATEAKQDTQITAAGVANTALGAPADTAAVADTSNVSLISLFKRSLQKLTLIVTGLSKAGGSLATSSVEFGTESLLLVAARPTRRKVIFTNIGNGGEPETDTVIYITEINPATVNGFRLPVHQSCSFDTNVALYGIGESSTLGQLVVQEIFD